MNIAPPDRDWVRQPVHGFVLWCLPLAAGIAGRILLPVRTAAIVWAVAFLWMGAACLANALRCHRLHCYISGPVFLLGAACATLFAAGAKFLGAHTSDNIVSATLLLVLLSFVPEFIWRKYIQNEN